MARKAAKKKTRKVSKKVPVAKQKVKVFHLKCTNCGEEESKVLVCGQCDGYMDVEEIKEVFPDEIEDEIAAGSSISGNSSSSGGGLTSDEDGDGMDDVAQATSDDDLEEVALTNIFPGGESGGDGSGSDGDEPNMDELNDIINEE